MGRQTADSAGIAIAQAAQDAVPDATVILFGSRARGDHRAESDVDLLVVADAAAESDWLAIETRASRAAHRKLREFPGKFGIDIIGMSRSRFDYCRTAKTHLAAQALKDGIIMTGHPDDFPPLLPDEKFPVNWADVRQRVINANRWQRSVNFAIDYGHDDQELIGFIAQQSVENALKGWIAAIDCEYRNLHRLDDLASIIFDNVPANSSPACDWLDDLMAYILLPPEQLAARRPYEPRDWLSRYAVLYRYGGAEYRLNQTGFQELKAQINRAVIAIVEHIHYLTGTGPSDLDNPTHPG